MALELPQQVTMLQLDVGKDGKGPTYYVDTEIMTALFFGESTYVSRNKYT